MTAPATLGTRPRAGVIAETNGSGAAGTLREYIWLPEAEIAPTMGSRTTVDRPLAVVDGVNTGSPVTYTVHVDHLHRPIKMTNAAKASIWTAVWAPWGGPLSITGPASLDARLPGQWFQLEAGLHYNWHRSYDPSLGRYTQPDPLGFVDGPSQYAYGLNSPYRYVDKDGRYVPTPPHPVVVIAVACIAAYEYLKPKMEPPPRRPHPDPKPKEPERCNKMTEKERPDGGRQCMYLCEKSGQTKVIYTYLSPLIRWRSRKRCRINS